MILLARAPFLAVLAGLTAMLALSDRVLSWALPPVALLAACGVMLCSFGVELRGQWRAAAATLAVLLFASSWVAFFLVREPFIPSSVQTAGTVTESRPWGRFYAVTVKTPLGGFLLKLPQAELAEGDRIQIEGRPRPLRSDTGTSDFREDRFWKARGVYSQLMSPRFQRLPAGWSIHRWRYGLHRAIAIHLPRLTGAYLDASWTGMRDAGLNQAHRAWGTSHLLSVSGFHVGVVMMSASLVFRRGKWRVLGLSLLLWFYIFLTGAPASAVRAGLMLQLSLLGELAGRPGSPLNSVSLAAVLLLMFSPFWFWDIGWRLSVLAALVIAAVLERGASNDWKIWFVISPLIWFATFPQVAWTFGLTPVAGVLINLAAPPFFSFALSVASGAALLRLTNLPGITFLADAFLYVLEGTFLLWGHIADAAARLIPWQLGWNPFLAYCCAGFFITLMCRALFVPWRSVAVLAPLGSLTAFVLFGFLF